MSKKDRLLSGTVFLMGASLANVISSYLIHIGLARFLGPGTYGIFGVLMSLFIINRGFLGSGIPKATSKYIAEARENTAVITRLSVKLQLFLALVLASIFIAFADDIAVILKDQTLSNLIAFIGIMSIPLALLFLYFDGYLNGLRQFRSEALAKILHSFLRILFVFLFVLLGLKLFGVLLGYFLAIIIALIISVSKFGIKMRGKGSYPKKKIIFFGIPITIISFTWILVRNINILLIKSLLRDNVATGFYTAASALSDVPYIMFAALSVTMLPVISESVSSNNIKLTKKYISTSLRYLLMGMLPITAMISATSTNLLTLLYSSRYAPAGKTLSILIFGTMFLIILLVLISIIMGSGKPIFAAGFTTATLIILTIISSFFIPKYGIQGAALSSVIASFIGLMSGATYVYIKFGTLTKINSMVRILLASAIIYVIASLLQVSGILLIAFYAALFVIYFLLLYILREIKKEDVVMVKNVLRIG